jgi:hypothetical protein
MPQITRIVWEGREAEKGSPLPHIKTTRSSSLSRDLRQFSTSLPSSLNLPQIFSSRSPIATPLPPLMPDSTAARREVSPIFIQHRLVQGVGWPLLRSQEHLGRSQEQFKPVPGVALLCEGFVV